MNGYFSENSPAMLSLEAMVDRVGVENVLYALAEICREKQCHIEDNWQDKVTGKSWGRIATKIDNFVSRL